MSNSFICKFCGQECKKYGYKNHQNRCYLNPDRLLFAETWLKAMKEKRQLNQHTKAKERGEKYVYSEETGKKIGLASIGRKHSMETKEKISKKRRDFLHKNPDKVPYLLNHYSHGPSYPEIYWKEILEQNEIVYEPEYKISSYSLDFAILDKKIDLEIDGEQHYLDERIVKSDKRRNEYLMNNGWQIIRVRWSEFQKLDKQNKIDYIQSIITKITGL